VTNEARLNRLVQARIGDRLRRMYAGLIEEPIPDRFRELLDQLERLDEASGEELAGR
jgi:hypothetical protein